MNTIFMPADVFKPRNVDEAFQWEAEQIKDAGGDIVVFDADKVSNRENPFSRLGDLHANTKAFYRGWMLPLKDYSYLELSLRKHRIHMETEMPIYLRGHHLPEWYDVFESFTPKSFWFSPHHQSLDLDEARKLGTDRFIVKDYVKSRKNEWDDACYAPSIEALPTIVDTFVSRQKEDGALVGGVVVRAFEDFDKTIGEIRVWWVKGEPVFISNHPDNKGPIVDVDDYFLTYLREPVRRLGNPFITTDLAMNLDGRWRVVEIGDGQVSGLPQDVDATKLWKALIA